MSNAATCNMHGRNNKKDKSSQNAPFPEWTDIAAPLHDHPRKQRSIFSPRLVAISVATLLLCFVTFAVARILFSVLSSNRFTLHDEEYSRSGLSFTSFLSDRNNCEIIYILGVEGSVHHGFEPVLEKLASVQVDPVTGAPYDVEYSSGRLRSALFGFHGTTRPIDDPKLIRSTLNKICPQDGKKRIIIEDASFPAGAHDDPRTYRIHRQRWWSDSTMEEIATSDTALNHPTNLFTFYNSYSPFVSIKFIVLHRSYVETIASHPHFDGTIEQHSNVIGGYLLLLRKFLDVHPTDKFSGERLWTLVCIDRLMPKFYAGNEEQLSLARNRILEYLVQFLSWHKIDCPDCFSHWTPSKKKHVQVLGAQNMDTVLGHMKKLGGTWPPKIENALQDQICSL